MKPIVPAFAVALSLAARSMWRQQRPVGSTADGTRFRPSQ